MQLPIQYLNPVVLQCRLFDGYTLDTNTQYGSRVVYDYEFEYYLQSDGGIIVDDKYIPFSAGDISLRKPGQVVQGLPPYRCYILCVDMLGNQTRSPGYNFGTPDEAQARYDNSLLNRLPDKLTLRKKDMAQKLFETIYHAHGADGDLSYFSEKSSLYYLLQEIFHEAYSARPSGGTRKINAAVQTIRQNYADALSVESLVAESGLSHAFFHSRFREETGLTPNELITRLRIEKAQNLLSVTKSEIGDIGTLCGYPDRAYFARVFRRQTGLSPSEFRERIGWRTE